MTTLCFPPRLFIVVCILLISNHLVHSWSSPGGGAFFLPSSKSSAAATTTAINTWQSFPLSSRRRSNSRSITPITSRTATSTTILWNSQWEKDIEAGTRRRVQTGQTGSGTGETVAGAVLGGLLLGPFGALFGASIGSSLGGKNALQKARQQELERLGITQEMLDSAQDIGVALERSLQGLKTVQESLDTQQRFARRLDAECNDLYDKAKNLLSSNGGNGEDEARKLLLKRTRVQEQLKQVLQNCALAKKQQATLEENARRLEQRAMEIDTLLRRASGAKAMQDSALTTGLDADVDFGLSLRDSDPLLQKFKDMGID